MPLAIHRRRYAVLIRGVHVRPIRDGGLHGLDIAAPHRRPQRFAFRIGCEPGGSKSDNKYESGHESVKHDGILGSGSLCLSYSEDGPRRVSMRLLRFWSLLLALFEVAFSFSFPRSLAVNSENRGWAGSTWELPPMVPTDPDLPNSGIRLVKSGIRFATVY